MHTTYRIVLLVHVLASALGLGAMFPALIARKGAAVHRRAGWLFTWGMAISAVTGMLLALSWVLAPTLFRADRTVSDARMSGLFLLLIGALSGNSLVQAHHALARKLDAAAARTGALLSLAALALVAASGLVSGLVGGHLLCLTFGAASLTLVARDLGFVLRPLSHPRAYLYQHIQAMGTACITAVTAFTVLGGRRLLQVDSFGNAAWLLWVLPGAVMGPLFHGWVLRYRRKFEGARSARAAHMARLEARG